jgi:hypothetical protein
VLGALALLLTPAVLTTGGTPAPVRYHIEASVDGPDITGHERIEIDPSGAAERDDVMLFLFPNLLTQRLPGEDSKSFYTIQPARWSRGWMQLTKLSLEDGTELAWTGEEMERPDGKGGRILLPPGVAIRASLPAPATGTVTLEAEFTVHVPERFGTFSWYRDQLFATGGWYPMVAPRDAAGRWDPSGTLPRADADVAIDADAHAWVSVDRNLQPPSSAGRRTVTAHVSSRPDVMLLVARHLSRSDVDEKIELLQPRKARCARRERRIALSARDFLEAGGWIAPGAPAVPLLEAPLTRELTFPDAPLGLVSERVYRVYRPLQKYHDLHVARAEIAGLIRDRVYALEPGDDASWVLDGVSWWLAREWQRKTHGGLRDVRDYARPLAFLPAVDVVLNTPDFPFFAEYYDNFYFTDLLRDDVSRFNNVRPNGRVVWEKLVDRAGISLADAVMRRYLDGSAPGGFRAAASSVTGEDLGDLFETWRSPLPLVDYGLVSASAAPLPDGRWLSTLKLDREGPDVGDVVRVRAVAPARSSAREILVLDRDGHTWIGTTSAIDADPLVVRTPAGTVSIPRSTIASITPYGTRLDRPRDGDGHGVWDASSGRGTLYLYTRNRPTAWEVDWPNRLLETDRRDNRIPPSYHFLLQYAYVDYDFKLNTADAAISFSLEKSNDLSNELDFVGFRRQQSSGGSIAYVHSFGRFTYYRGLLHRFGAYLYVEQLSKGFSKNGLHVVPGFDPSVNRVEATIGPQLFYRYDSRDDWRFSRHGTRVFVGVETGTSFKGPAVRYTLAELDAVNQLRISDNNVLATQLRAGTFFATRTSDVPLSKLYYLGGIDDLRGISAPDVVGPTKMLLSAEWRNYFLYDVDWDLYFFRIRGVQGALFADAGYIAPKTSVVPPASEWITDVGYGLRQHYDFFGVRPMVFREDLAQRTDDLSKTRKPDLRFYIAASQSF